MFVKSETRSWESSFRSCFQNLLQEDSWALAAVHSGMTSIIPDVLTEVKMRREIYLLTQKVPCPLCRCKHHHPCIPRAWIKPWVFSLNLLARDQ